MSAVVQPTEQEMYLLALLDSADGLDLAEFIWYDPESSDGCYRAWDFQWSWYTCNDMYQIDQGGRALGKTVGIKMRACAFPFFYAGQRMLLSAPELNHLRPLTDEIEKALLSTRLLREMLPDGKGHGIARQPHWQVRFKNNTGLISRLPNKDGKGVKGCLAGGTLIATDHGQVPIEDVRKGDWVLTHENRYRPVEGTFRYADPDAVVVAGGGHQGLVMSESHSMYARRNRNPQRTRNLEPAGWLNVANDDEATRHYLASPVQVPFEITPCYFDSVARCALAGAWVANGHVNRRLGRVGLDGISITDDTSQVEYIQSLIKDAGFESRVYEKPSMARRIDVTDRVLAEALVVEFGELAAGKRIPTWLLGAPSHLRRAFFDAYLRGDGYWGESKGRWEASSASKPLIIALRLLAQSLGYVCGYSWHDPDVRQIAGTDLLKPPQRSHRLRMCQSQRNAVIEDGITWQKIRSVEPASADYVYDLHVKDDHSYIADGLISHNQHVINIELDEAQDYPLPGWIEIVETLNAGLPGAMWRCHGVSKGVRDKFFEKTQEDSGWTTHRPMAMHRPTWGPIERANKIKEYGGSRQSIDYRRNIYGEHGDAANSVFVLARLMNCVDLDEGSIYNDEVYTRIKLEFEHFPPSATDDERLAMIHGMIDIPGNHLHGYSQRDGTKEAGAPRGYSAYWGGMDVGVTNHPSEILVFGQRTGTEMLELLLRIQMHRINTDDQKEVIARVMDFYGNRIRFGIDKTGVGFPLWDQMSRTQYGDRIYGFGFSEKRVVGFEDRPLVGTETMRDLARMRNFVEATTDWLRNDYVDAKRFRLPYDREVLIEFQGQVYTVVRDTGDPYGVRRQFAGGSFHTLDAAKVAIGTKHIPPLEAMLDQHEEQHSVLDMFIGA